MMTKEELKEMDAHHKLIYARTQPCMVVKSHLELYAENERLTEELKQARSEIIERLFNSFKESEIIKLQKEVDRLKVENSGLKVKINHLAEDITQMERTIRKTSGMEK